MARPDPTEAGTDQATRGGVVSCGVVILNPARELFACRATGRGRWDLPKGLAEPGEAPRATAVREAAEEAALCIEPALLCDLGVFDYLPQKRLHLFGLRVGPDAFDIAECRCRSTFVDMRSGRLLPEVDDYAWKPVNNLDGWCGKNLARVLGALDWARIARLREIGRVPLAAGQSE